MTDSIQNRYDFVLLFDVKDGNPNGDPDAGNLPRIDAETGEGLITDVCLKRKIRNYVGLRHEYQPPNNIYIKEKSVLIETHKRAYEALELSTETDSKKGQKRTGGEKKDGKTAEELSRQWMCQNFYDVRTFGAVMSIKINCGQVRGPVQMTFARSVCRIISLEHSITRMAVATEREAEEQGGDNRTMGRKFTVPYGLYRAHGFVSASLAAQTGFGDADLDLLWEALQNMFEHDRSAARGEMVMRGLYVFKHGQKLGNAPAHELFECIKVSVNDENKPPRGFQDFTVNVEEPKRDGVTLERKLG